MATALSDDSTAAYAAETRFGIVMYGGVSLAIYINGVANELYEMCCATPKLRPVALPQAASTREVYRKLSWLLRNPGLRAAYLAHLDDGSQPDPFAAGDPAPGNERVRFVVDVIAGTSAGGINGIFLAKALANGEAFAPLKDLWVLEGDIGSLLNDEQSYQDIAYAKRRQPPQSLLNSDRMYLKLLDAMERMSVGDRAMSPVGIDESTLSDELDLYITTTDIVGAVVPLRLFDKVVYERRHKQVYHFQYAGSGGRALRNDFKAENNPFLAFTARCTSSFPFAFEPMQVADAERLGRMRPGGGALDFGRWKSFFTGLSADDMSSERWRKRSFGDGGYLDNKPFTYVVEALSWRLAPLPMERKLLYVEPAPAHPERNDAGGSDAKPDAIDNAIAALTHIPQYETIREDLESVLRRNRRIERVERIVRKVEADVDASGHDPFANIVLDNGVLCDWSTLDMGDMIEYHGVAFLPYRRLRLATVNDDLAERLAERWQVDPRSDLLYAVQALVRAWREHNYYEHKPAAEPGQILSVNRFLADFDVLYRVRRVGFLLRKTHQITRLVRRLADPAAAGVEQPTETEQALMLRLRRHAAALDELDKPTLFAALAQLRGGLAAALSDLRRVAWPPANDTPRRASAGQRDVLQQILRMLLGERLDPPLVALDAVSGDPVRLVIDDMPLPSPVRTLQENVSARANFLFLAASAGRRTRLQQVLEDDIAEIGAGLAGATARRIATAGGAQTARSLLGAPRLTVPAAVPGIRRKVVVTVDDLPGGVGAATLNTTEGRMLRSFLAEYYLRFDEYDQVSFPLYYDTGTGEPSTVEVVRISPEDAPSLIDEDSEQRRKLAGTFLFNFGAFLARHWRSNDIMWGRLDGCERLLATLLPSGSDDKLRRALLEQAQRAILRVEMTEPYYAELVRRFTAELRRQGGRCAQDDFDALVASLQPNDGQQASRTALALKAVLGDDGVLDFVRDHYEVDRRLDAQQSLDTASRAITITGRILEQIEKRQRDGQSHMVWVTRAGLVLQGLLAVSTPGRLLPRLWRHGLLMLYLFEIVVLLGGVMLNEPLVRNFGFTAFVLTLVLHVATLLTGDLIRHHLGLAKALAAASGAGVILLAALGAAGLVNTSLARMLCGDAVPDPKSALACRWLR